MKKKTSKKAARKKRKTAKKKFTPKAIKVVTVDELQEATKRALRSAAKG